MTKRKWQVITIEGRVNTYEAERVNFFTNGTEGMVVLHNGLLNETSCVAAFAPGAWLSLELLSEHKGAV